MGQVAAPTGRGVWELHPVYNIEICKFTSKTKCDTATKKAWVNLCLGRTRQQREQYRERQRCDESHVLY
jgi:hypothetical protein